MFGIFNTLQQEEEQARMSYCNETDLHNLHKNSRTKKKAWQKQWNSNEK